MVSTEVPALHKLKYNPPQAILHLWYTQTSTSITGTDIRDNVSPIVCTETSGARIGVSATTMTYYVVGLNRQAWQVVTPRPHPGSTMEIPPLAQDEFTYLLAPRSRSR